MPNRNPRSAGQDVNQDRPNIAKRGKTKLPVAGTDAPDRFEGEPLLSTSAPEQTSTRKAQEDERPGG